MRWRLLARAGVVALGVVLVAGCGGSSGPTKAAWDSQANSVCATYNSKLSGLGTQLQSSSSLTQAESALAQVLPLAQQGTNKLQALARPGSISSGIATAINAQQQQVSDIAGLLQDLKAGNASGARDEVTKLDASGTTVNADFDAVGATTCGSGSGGS